MRTKHSISIFATFAALLALSGALAADAKIRDGDPNRDPHTGATEDDEELAMDLDRFRGEFMRRMAERGVTVDDLDAAARGELDEQELLGYTDEEYAAIYESMAGLAARIAEKQRRGDRQPPPPPPADPADEPHCNWGLGGMCSGLTIWASRYMPATYGALAFVGATMVACYCTSCRSRVNNIVCPNRWWSDP